MMTGVITVLQAGETLAIQRLYVRPAFQRQGVGARLLSSAVAQFPTA
jgi:GNAT superfamily N-acetyltransferase